MNANNIVKQMFKIGFRLLSVPVALMVIFGFFFSFYQYFFNGGSDSAGIQLAHYFVVSPLFVLAIFIKIYLKTHKKTASM